MTSSCAGDVQQYRKCEQTVPVAAILNNIIKIVEPLKGLDVFIELHTSFPSGRALPSVAVKPTNLATNVLNVK